MNAEDRGTRPTTGENASPWPPSPSSSVTPASGTNPQRTSLRSGQFPTRPVTGENPTRPVSSPSATAPRTGSNVFAPQTGATPVRPAGAAAPASTPAPARPAAPTEPAAPSAESEKETAFGKIKASASRTRAEVRSADPIAASASKGGPRKVRVLVSRVDPWSALKIGFLLSIAVGIILVVAVYVLWNVLNTMGIFTTVNEWILTLFPEDAELDLMQFLDLNRIMAATTLIAVVDVVLLSALATISAFLYNVISAVVGGFYVTLTDD